MARKPRYDLPGIPQHIVQRGNNRRPCFFEVADYRRYLSDLAASADRHDCSVHAYVLMTNHVHLLVTSGSAGGQSSLMQALGRRYVSYVNRRYERSGTLWEGRFKAAPIDSDAYLLVCMRYIELNPVRAGVAAAPGDYPWSSYRANAESGQDPVVSPHPLYEALAPSRADRRRIYRQLFQDSVDDGQLRDIRQSLNRGLVLGRSDFKEIVASVTGRRTRPGRAGRPRVGGRPP